MCTANDAADIVAIPEKFDFELFTKKSLLQKMSFLFEILWFGHILSNVPISALWISTLGEKYKNSSPAAYG